MMPHAARSSRPAGTAGHARTAPVAPDANHRLGGRAFLPPGLRPSTARNVHRTFRPSGPATDHRGAGMPSDLRGIGGVRNVETRSATRPETSKSESPRP